METRPVRDARDVAQVVAIHNAIYADDPIGVTDFVAWGEQARERQDLVAERDGTVVGGSRTYIESQRPHPWAHIWIPPQERRRGIGSALFVEISRWAAERGHTGLEAWVREDSPASLAFAAGLGFEETGREHGLVLDLTALDPPGIEAPERIELTTWAERPELARGLYEVFAEAIPDVPGEEDSAVKGFEEWLRRDMRSAGDRADATFLALAGDEVIGYAKFAFTSVQPTTAHHDLTGVKRAWRGRGIARALKAMQIRWAKENGFEELRTRNEERNTPIKKLNDRFGYRPAVGRIYLRGPVA